MNARTGAAVLSLAAFLAAAAGGAARAQGYGERAREGGFELFLNQDYREDGGPVLVAAIAIPYKRLVFFLRDGRYEARFRVFLEIIDGKGNRVRGEVWEETVSTGNFRETTSGAALARSSKRFSVASGEYRAKTTIEVVNTSRRFMREESVRIVGGGGALDLSKPAFFSGRPDSLDSGPLEGTPRFTAAHADGACGEAGRQGSVFGQIGLFARVRYDVVVPEEAAGQPIVFSTRVRDAAGEVVLYHRAVLRDATPGPAVLCLDVSIDSWSIGLYTIESFIESDAVSQRQEAEGRFLVLMNGGLFGPHIGDLSTLLDLIADADDAAAVTQAPAGERFSAWAAFWRERDPTPSTASNEAFGEFLERLRHVLENYSQTGPGFRTDRGRIYIADGPPDRIERHSETNLRSYELWYYNGKGVVYIFEDAIGSGDYRLLTTRFI